MPLKIVQNDITKMKVDAIVNAANETLLGGGGVDGAIHQAAGPELLKACRKLGGCETGDAKITKGYRLPCKYVIHTVGPIWHGGEYGEKEKLISCYRASLNLAEKYHCETVAFPLISAGVYGYPKDQALSVAVSTISEFLSASEMTVYIVIYHQDDFQISPKLIRDIREYIDDHYEVTPVRNEKYFAPQVMAAPSELEKAVNAIDETFSQMLLRKIDEKGMTDVQCYKKANIDRKLFSKIRSNKQYQPSKPTVLAFSIALELSLDETKDLLLKAGFALSKSSVSDIVVEYFISRGNYDINEINQALFAFNQNLLGG